MKKRKSMKSSSSSNERKWQPLWLANYGRKLQSGEPGAAKSILAWLDESGDELQADLDSVHLCHPRLVGKFDVTDLRARIKQYGDQTEALAAIGVELIALDKAINSTRQELDEILPDDLFLGDASDEEIEKHIRERLNLCA